MEKEQEQNNHYALLVNLKNDCSIEDMSSNLLYLFKRVLQLDVDKSDIEIKEDSCKPRQAFIHVATEEDLQSAIEKLKSSEERSKLQFNFLSIVNPDADLQVRNGSDTSSEALTNLSVYPETKKTENVNVDSSGIVTDKGEKEETETEISDKDGTNSPKQSETMKPSNQKVNLSIKYLSDAWKVRSYKASSFRTQGTKIKPKENENYYMEGETLGKQTINRSFVDGDGEIHEFLINNVPMYVCGFLNSNHNGTLNVGVSDDGCVAGFRCELSSDAIKQTIDDAIKEIRPSITSSGYHISMVPVYDKFGGVKGSEIDTYRVIEVSVERTVNLYQLYEVNGEVFSRKDGAHYRMKPSEIKEWYHIKQLHQEELENALRRQKLDLESTREFERENFERKKVVEMKSLSEEKEKYLFEALEKQRLENENKNKKDLSCVFYDKEEEIKRLKEEKAKEQKKALEAQRLEYETKIDNERNKMFSDKDGEIKQLQSEKDQEFQTALDVQKSEYEEKLENERQKMNKEKLDEMEKLKNEKDKEISKLKSQIEEMKSEKEQNVKSKTCIIL